MILAASLILGSYFGWKHGRTSTAYARFAIGWFVVLVAQTTLLLAATDSVRDRDTGTFDATYPVMCIAALALGLLVVTASTVIRHRRPA